jgi:hypothetical protein
MAAFDTLGKPQTSPKSFDGIAGFCYVLSLF